MAKGQNRGNREPKKPKATKKPPAASTSPFSKTPSGTTPPKPGKK
jgi:hypothetical protein